MKVRIKFFFIILFYYNIPFIITNKEYWRLGLYSLFKTAKLFQYSFYKNKQGILKVRIPLRNCVTIRVYILIRTLVILYIIYSFHLNGLTIVYLYFQSSFFISKFFNFFIFIFIPSISHITILIFKMGFYMVLLHIPQIWKICKVYPFDFLSKTDVFDLSLIFNTVKCGTLIKVIPEI